MLNEGTIVLRVEDVVVEVFSPSDLRSLPANSDCGTTRSLFNNQQIVTPTRRSCMQWGNACIMLAIIKCEC